MTHSFKLSRRIARLRAPAVAALILAFTACDTTNSLDPDSSASPESGVPAAPAGATDAASLASTALYSGGIPLGLFHLPNGDFGSRYNGALRTVGPTDVMSDLSAIRARGGKVVLNLAGSQRYYKDSDGHFSLTKWKARVARYRNLNLSSYINDGTIIGHYLIDEPYDAHNFAGRAVTGSTLEAMAKYSKGIWPGMATIVRAEPYLIKWSGTYHYLDAAWAQYLYRKGNVNDYIAKNVSVAKSMGLGLVVGLNIRDGGVRNQAMTASQVQSWGSTLIGSTYTCGFISWKSGDSYLSTTSMKNAMSHLRSKAQNRAAKSCRG